MYRTIRIKNKGHYLGYNCPAENINVSDFVIQILQAMGADVEIYDPAEEARKAAEAKQKQEALSKAQYDAEFQKLVEAANEQRIQELEAENAAKQAYIDNLEAATKPQEDSSDDTVEEFAEEQVVEVDADPKTKIYSDEELSIMTMAELKTILVGRGHVNALYDKLAPRTKDRRPDLLRKVKETQ